MWPATPVFGVANNILIRSILAFLLAQVLYNRRDPDETRSDMKLLKLKQDESYNKWMKSYTARLDAKKKQKEAERGAYAEKVEAEKGKKKDATFAFNRWLTRKEDAKRVAAEKQNADEKKMSRFRALPHVRGAVERICKKNELFVMMDQFMLLCAGRSFDGVKHVCPKEIELDLSAALVQTKVIQRVLKLKSEKDRGDKSMSKDDKVKERVRMKIGQQILATLQSGRQLFGTVIGSVQDVFEAADKNGNGILEKEEFRGVLSRLDLGLTTPQLQDLWATFDVDQSGGIDFGEFEDILVGVEAQQQIDTPPPPTSKRMKLADSILTRVGAKLANKLFNKVFAMAEELRVSEESSGIGLWDFRAALRRIDYEKVSISQKNDFMKSFEKLFGILDRKKVRVVWAVDACARRQIGVCVCVCRRGERWYPRLFCLAASQYALFDLLHAAKYYSTQRN